jgi:predicted N-acyltransferase
VLTSAVTTLDETPAVSSWHILFPVEAQAKAFRDQGLLQRFGCQFHWHNRGYASFDEFLAALNSRKRKNIRKERQSVLRKGITFERVDGAQITPDQWRQFYDFYQSTYRIRGMEGYLNLEFFNQVSATMPENVLLIFARKEGEIIAGAMFFRDSSRLYGRYWGCREDFQFLHFETCFYQGIEYCIANGLSHFDAGAQGEHKIQRGFEPELTTSMHWIADTRLRPAIADFLNRERRYIEHYRDEASNYLPFRQTDP